MITTDIHATYAYFFILATHLMYTLGEFPSGIPEDSQFTDDLESIINFRKFRFYYLKEKKKDEKEQRLYPWTSIYKHIYCAFSNVSL